MIIAVDFDNTLFRTCYPSICEPNWTVINWCKEQQDIGNILILWTCRNGKNLKEALKACKSVGLKFDYVNKHSKEMLKKFGRFKKSKKVFADIYIDDHAYRPEEISLKIMKSS